MAGGARRLAGAAMRLIATALNLALMLAAAPGFAWLLAMAAALRDRAPVPAPLAIWRLWWALWRAEQVRLSGVSAFADAAIAAGLAAAILAAALIPTFTTALATAPFASLPLVVALLALAAILPLLSLMAAGTMAGGIAAGRILGFFCAASPALFLTFWALAQLGGGVMLNAIATPGGVASPLAPRLLAAIALAAIARAAPTAAAESSGRARTMALATTALTQLGALSLVAALLVPFGIAGEGQGLLAAGIGLLLWLVKMAVAAGLLAWLRPARPPASRLLSPALTVATICAALAALLAQAPLI
jgi:formate hydrogenlyase subunit 4